MSGHDHCPTKHTHADPGEGARPGLAPGDLVARASAVNGARAWRSLEEYCDAPEFREHVEKEFARGALEMHRAFEAGGETRRDFLKIMGASMALAGVASMPGCRRPDHTILAYSKEVPEEVIPGKALYYATAMALPGGGAEGLLVETHEGRPTKIEGNPLHPTNAGRCSSRALASVLGLYDPDRIKAPTYENPARGRVEATWDDFRAWAGDHFKPYLANGGEGLAVVLDKKSSPTRAAMRAALATKFPKARIVAFDPLEARGAAEGSRAAFGRPAREVLNITPGGTRVILSLDGDFIGHGPDALRHARMFAATRRVMATRDSMSRLYCVESGLSLAGGQADHRLRLSPTRVSAFAVEFARFVLSKLGSAEASALAGALAGSSALEGRDKVFLEECAKDILDPENRGKSLIVAGPTQPAAVHALVHALNASLGNVGNSVSYLPSRVEGATLGAEDLAEDSIVGMKAIVDGVRTGAVKTLVVVDANPAYASPGSWEFAKSVEAAKKNGLAMVTLAVGQSETAELSTWVLNGAHYLESWGDARSHDGTLSPVQPMIAPLYEPAMSEIEFLALLGAGDFSAKVDGYEIVRRTWREAGVGGEGGFERAWRRALFDGVVAGSAGAPAPMKASMEGVAKAAQGLAFPASPGSLEVVFSTAHVGDGRDANASWLQELPQFGTMVVWDNPALMSPTTAKALGLLPTGYSDHDPSRVYTKPTYPEARLANVTLEGKTVRLPVWILPGMADDTIIVHLGYGRTKAGLVGDGVGVDAYPLLPGQPSGRATLAASGAKAVSAGGRYMIASTQNHWSLEGRTSIARSVDLGAWAKHGDEVQKSVDRFYGTTYDLNFAERLGELSHTPPNKSLYAHPYNTGATAGDGRSDAEPGSIFAERPQWGMTIDLATCTGCGACTIACQAENNIPVVGKKEAAKGREMAWIRVDRYFVGDDFANPDQVLHQPVACVHCEYAPCETVCPVNATVHGPEGLNYMTYNRCIGTRYCANNCPYKVRRYNFFEYGKLKFNGGYIGKGAIDGLGDLIPGQGVGPNGSPAHNKININFIPPRLRDKIDEIERMGKNPNVSVRMRGVMEKCTYCVQRINAAKVECKLKDIKDASGKPVVPDGFFQAACQQACPSEAITFGDTLDPSSKVHATRNHARSYLLLGYLNTRPRTSHMARVTNPNPRLREPNVDPFHHHDHGDHGGGSGGGHGGGASHGFFFDRSKRRDDQGYAMSLTVLSNGAPA